MSPIEAPRSSYTSSVTRKGQVTIPVHIRRLLGLSTADKVAFVVSEGKVQISPAEAQGIATRTAGALGRYRRKPAVGPRQERDAFEQAVADEVAGSPEA